MNLTASQIRFLLAVLSLTSMDEDVASKNIAHILGISRPSVHGMLEQMIERGLVEKARYGRARLTAEGFAVARALETRRDNLMLLFIRRDSFPMDEALIAATSLMGALKEESLQALEAQLDS
ncbi:MAG: metal-dependent transcriptional regulator [Aristaeellaceae bacterium]